MVDITRVLLSAAYRYRHTKSRSVGLAALNEAACPVAEHMHGGRYGHVPGSRSSK